MLYNSEYQPISSTGGVLGTSLVDLTSISFADLFAQAADYSAGTTYNKGTLAYSQNTIWVYINATASSGNAPPALPTISNTYWELVGSAGTFTWIAYASSADGLTNFTTNTYDSAGITRTYIGIANNKTTAVESGIYTDYSWSKFVGTDGIPGAPAKSMVITSDRQLVTFDSSGLLSPSPQNINFTANKQNTTATVNWTIKDTTGNVLTPSSYLNNTAGDTTQMTGAQFRSALLVNGAQGLVITATLIDGITIVDTISVMKVQAAVNGVNAVSAYITSEAQSLFAYANGNVVSFANANGLFKVYSGTTDVTSSATGFSAVASGCTGTINTAFGVPVAGQPIGYYRVTAMSADIATLTLSATYSGTTFTKIYSLSKTKGGYEILATLPATDLFEGRVVFLTTDDKLYRYTGATWVTSVPATDISGTLADAQISALAASKVTGQLSDTQLAAIAAAKITGQITTTQITDAAITTSKFSSGIEPVTLVTSVPLVKSTNTIFNSTDGKLYRWNGSSYVASIPSIDVTGTLTDAQLAAISAAKITGTLTDAQLSAISIAKVKGAVGGGNLLSNTNFKNITGTINTDGSLPFGWDVYNNLGISVTTKVISGGLFGTNFVRITANAATTNTFGIYTTQGQYIWTPGLLYVISFWARAGSANVVGKTMISTYSNMGFSSSVEVTNPGLLQNTWQRYITVVNPANNVWTVQGELFLSVLSGSWPSGGILEFCGIQLEQGELVSAYAPRVDEILPGTITSTEIANDAITSPKIIAGAITAGKIEANSITANEIAANAITASELAAGSVIAGKIAASSITATELAAGSVIAGKIAADSITANEIAANAITATELAAGSVIAGKIAAGTITATQIASDTITAGQIAAGAITTSELSANAVTAEKLTVTSRGDSVILNSGFEEASSVDPTLPSHWKRFNVWGGTSTTAFRDTSVTLSGTASLALIPGASLSADCLADQVPVAAGEQWYIACKAKSMGTNAGSSAGFYFRVRGGALQTSIDVELYIDIENLAVPTTWTKYEGIVNIPSGMGWAAPILLNYLTNSGAKINIDEVEFRKVITSAIIANGAITTSKIAANAITSSELAAGSVIAGKIAADSITANEIAANAITATELAAGSITTAKLAAGAVTASTIAADTITANNIAANAITSSELATNAITADKITAGAITAGKIAAASITSVDIAANSITASNINANGLSIKDTSGNIILSAGGAVNFASLSTSFPGATNITSVSNSSITISSGALNGIGTGNGTAVANNAITMNSNGTISGAGGGQVTIGGLGYSGDLNATNGATIGSNLSGAFTEAEFNARFNTNVIGGTYIKDAAITDAKIANLSANKIISGSISTSLLVLDGLRLTNNGGSLSIQSGGVDTAQIALQSVTRVVAVNNPSQLNPTVDTWTTFSSATINVTSGTSVRLDASLRVLSQVSSFFGSDAQIRIIRTVSGVNTVVLSTFISTISAANFTIEFDGGFGTGTFNYNMATNPSVVFVDAHNSSGAILYTVQVLQNGGTGFENLTFVCTEIRR